MSERLLDNCTIVFDLDGTLIDSAPDIRHALNIVLQDQGLAPMALEDMRNLIGKGGKTLMRKAAATQGVELTYEQMAKMHEDFIVHYANDIATLSQPFPGLVDALDQMEALGAQFSVCTNKRTQLSVDLLEKLNLAHRFKAIVGSDAVENHKPHADHFLAAVARAGGDAELALMVGDSESDAGTAIAAQAPLVLVDFGYTEIAPQDLHPDAIISHFSELTDVATTLLRRDLD